MNESRIEIRGVGLHLRRGGKGAPLLFLHGVQGLPAEVAALERLAQRFDVLAPDHPGFGRSDAPDWVRRLREAALKDEDGTALDGAIKTIESFC